MFIRPRSPAAVPVEAENSAETENFVVLDWDDTLLPTTFLNYLRVDSLFDVASIRARLSQEVREELIELQAQVVSLIQRFLKIASKVHVVTSAGQGWVEMSAAVYMPEVAQLLPQLMVVSARSLYEKEYQDSEWKYQAILSLMQKTKAFDDTQTEKYKQLIACGDAELDRITVHRIADHYRNKGHHHLLLKNIKFIQGSSPQVPTISQLSRQIKLVIECFDYLYQHQENDLDLALILTSAPTPAPTPASTPTQAATVFAARPTTPSFFSVNACPSVAATSPSSSPFLSTQQNNR